MAKNLPTNRCPEKPSGRRCELETGHEEVIRKAGCVCSKWIIVKSQLGEVCWACKEPIRRLVDGVYE